MLFKFARRFSAKPFPSYERTMLAENFHAREHAVSSTSLWLKINIFITVPVTLAIGTDILL